MRKEAIMGQLNSFPDAIILGLEAVRTNLEQSLRHDDVSPTLRTNLAKVVEAVEGFIQLAQEAKAELHTSIQSPGLSGPDFEDEGIINSDKNDGPSFIGSSFLPS
jgi:hypothetical protein